MGVEARAAMVGFSLFIPQLEKSEPWFHPMATKSHVYMGWTIKKGSSGKWAAKV
jgi:hypothetical protein